MRMDEWIVGNGLDSGEDFIVHTLAPRFIALVDINLPGIKIKRILWIDPIPPAAKRTRWRQRAVAAFADFGVTLDRIIGKTAKPN